MNVSRTIFFVFVCGTAFCSPICGQPQSAVVESTFGDFANAISLSTNAAGELFVLDAGKNELSKFSPKGDLLKTIGGRGWGDFEFDSPTDVCAHFALDIYVADYDNRRLQRFDRKMNLVQSFTAGTIMPSLSGAFYPRACALSLQGELFVIESDGRRILKFTPTQQLEREFGAFNAGAGALLNPRDIAVGPEGNVFVLDDRRVVTFDTYANYLHSIPLDSLFVPSSISVSANSVLVTDRRRVVSCSYQGVRQFEITAQSLIGFEAKEEFRDAAIVSSILYILTAHTLVASKLVLQ